MRQIILTVAALLTCVSTAWATPWNIDSPSVAAKAWYLVDYDSGEVLAAHNSSEELPPASLTKLMVAYLAFKDLRSGLLTPNDEVPVSVKAWRTPGSRMFIRADTQVSVDELIKGLLVDSGNDAAIALAQRIGGSETRFVALMNSQAAALGMDNTHYSDATGLPHADHYSTARDLSMIARAIIRSFPNYYARWDSRKKFSYGGITQYNRNTLLWKEPGVDGMKTGYTRAAGYCLVASAERDGMRLIAVVLGADSPRARIEAGKKLLDFGFGNFETRLLYKSGNHALNVRVWMGRNDTLPAGMRHNLYLTIPRGTFDKVHTRIKAAAQIAPVRVGQKVGTMTLDFGHVALDQFPLIALQSVSRGNLFERTSDRLRMWLH